MTNMNDQAPTPTDLNIKPHMQAALFGLDGLGGALKNIQLSSQEIEAIVVIISLVLKTLGLKGLSDFVGYLLKLQDAITASNATPPTVAQK